MVDRVHIPKWDRSDDDRNYLTPGTWYVATDGDLWHRCPQCKKASVMANHSVTSAGEVNASIACFPPCSYHVWGTLDSWFYGEKRAGEKVKFTEKTCPGHVASDSDPNICGRCGVHIDELA